jgi:hypothetical protein
MSRVESAASRPIASGEARETWKDDQSSLDASKLVVIDETGTNIEKRY